MTSSTPQRSSHLSSQTRTPVYVDHDYGGDGMELDALPDQDGSGQSDGGFVWAPSVHSEASGPTPPPSTLLAAPPSPTWPPPLHRHPPQHPHHRLLHQQSWPLWRKSRSRGNITTGHHLPPARISGTKRSWTSSRCWPTWTTEKTYWPAWNPLPMDADRWELVLSPEEYLKPLQGLSGRNPVDQPGTTPEASHNLSPGTRL